MRLKKESLSFFFKLLKESSRFCYLSVSWLYSPSIFYYSCSFMLQLPGSLSSGDALCLKHNLKHCSRLQHLFETIPSAYFTLATRSTTHKMFVVPSLIGDIAHVNVVEIDLS